MTLPLLSIAVAAPFLAAAVLLLVPGRARTLVRLIAFAGAAVALAASVAVALVYDRARGGFQLGESYPLAPSIGITLRLAANGWSVALLLLTGIIITTGVLASWRSVIDRQKEFFVLLLTLVAGVFGVFVAQDLFVFFLFYEIAVLPMYLLIAFWGTSAKVAPGGPMRFVWKTFDIGDRQYAAMKLTLMLLVGSALILVGMLALYRAAGASTFDLAALEAHRYPRSLQLWVFPLFWVGFGTLAGIFPFHTWSPDGHAAAPTAVSMLHAGVLMKLGAFGVMRVGMVLLPEGAVAWAPAVAIVAAVNVVYGALCAMNQKDLKYIVAYSSVSHMGVVMLGAATLTANGWNGAVYQMFAHGIMTALLFALVGLVYERAHTREILKMGGYASLMPGIATFFTLACLSSLGLPGTAGFAAELMVFLGAWQSAWPVLAIPGVVGAFVTAVYVLRASRTIFWGPPPTAHAEELVDARGPEWPVLWTLGATIVVFGIWPRLLLDFIDPTTTSLLHHLAAFGAVLGVHP